MRQALLMTLVLAGALLLVRRGPGLELATAFGFAAITVVAVCNALTFIWLWWARTTPLALGMAFSWSGQAGLFLWWVLQEAPDPEPWSEQHALLLLIFSGYIVGGSLHIAVMQRSIGLRPAVLFLPALAVFALATAIAL